MRILMTTDTVGGVWTFTGELTGELLRRGQAVHLVSFGRRPSADQSALMNQLCETYPDRFGFTAAEIPLEWMQENDGVHADGEALLQDVIARFGPELILSNQFCFGRLDTRVPRVVVAHSDVLSWAKACRPSALQPTPWLNRYTSMVQAGLLNAAAVVTPTRWMSQALAANFLLPRGATVVPNGCGATELRGEASPELRAITAGRLWDEAKGIDTIRDLPLAMPVCVAGDDRFEQSDAGPAPEHVTSLGRLGRGQLHAAFRQSAVYLCLSRYEPFGLAPLEAALCGCAVIARDLPSLREVWGEGALFFKDTEGLNRILQSLVDEATLLTEARRRSMQRAARYTVGRMGDAYMALFASVLQQGQAMSHVA